MTCIQTQIYQTQGPNALTTRRSTYFQKMIQSYLATDGAARLSGLQKTQDSMFTLYLRTFYNNRYIVSCGLK